MARPTRVLIVEDDPTYRDELELLLAETDDFVLAASCPEGASALAFDGEIEMAIVDLGLPDGPGADVIRALRAERETLEVMAFTVFEERDVVFEAIVAGAGSYLLKGTPREEMIAALRELRAGGAPMSPKIARAVVEAFQQQGSVAERYVLSPRELEILRLLEEGYLYKEAAATLCVSPHTVHTHIKRIYEKLHARGRREALTKARLRGILR
ncbi:MAG: response regulator [Sandaracinaceae bacterium]